MSENKERRGGRESRRVHGSTPEVSGSVPIDPKERFFQNWAQIDQMRSEKEAQKREERESQEAQRRAEAEERQAERETQQRFLQILAEISRPSPAVLPPPSMPKLSVSKFIEGTDDMGAYLRHSRLRLRRVNGPVTSGPSSCAAPSLVQDSLLLLPCQQSSNRTMQLLEASCFGNITSPVRPIGVGSSRLPSPPPIQTHG